MNQFDRRRLGSLRGLVVVSAALLAGCGGGGGGGGSGAPSPTASVTASVTATNTSVATPTVPMLTPTTPPTVAAPSATPTEVLPTSTPTEVRVDTPTVVATATSTVESTQTPTSTPVIGPLVTAVGVADASGAFNTSVDMDPEGRPIFIRTSATGFTFYAEGRPGVSGLPVATQLLNSLAADPQRRPDLQISASRPLGNGSATVCDRSFPNSGGVPAIVAADFPLDQTTSNALNDLSCRFKTYLEADFACTQDNAGNLLFASAASTTQFCMLVDENLAFPTGDTVVTVRLRDTAGNAGEAKQIVVRIVRSTN